MHFTLQVHWISMLTTLNLDIITVSGDLINFLVGHKNTLEEVSLNTCYIKPTFSSIERNINCIHQSELFTSIVSVYLDKLHWSALVGWRISFPEKETLANIYKEKNNKVRNILQQDSGKIFFVYAF